MSSLDPLEVGEPGWAGAEVLLLTLDRDGPRTLARVSLDAGGAAVTDDARLAELWAREGIVGRGHQGRLFPAHGQDFLDELPFVYRGAALRAVPAEAVL